MKRFYGSDYADRINGQLQNTIDSVEDNYFASLNAVYPNSNKALAYKSDALGVARSAQSSIQRIIDKIESVAILLTEFYDYVENTGAAIDVLADDVFDIVTCINTAIGELSDLLNGVGAYKGIEVSPQAVNSACASLDNIKKPLYDFFANYFLDEKGELKDDAVMEYLDHVDACQDPSKDVYASRGAEVFCYLIQAKAESIDKNDDKAYQDFMNQLMGYFYYQKTDLEGDWFSTHCENSCIDEDNNDVPVVYFNYSLRNSSEFIFSLYDYSIQNGDADEFINSYRVKDVMKIWSDEMEHFTVAVKIDEDYRNLRNENYTGDLGEYDSIDDIPTYYDTDNVKYPIPDFSITTTVNEYGQICTAYNLADDKCIRACAYDYNQDYKIYSQSTSVKAFEIYYTSQFSADMTKYLKENYCSYIYKDKVKSKEELVQVLKGDFFENGVSYIDSAIGCIPVIGDIWGYIEAGEARHAFWNTPLTTFNDVKLNNKYVDSMLELYGDDFDPWEYAMNCGASRGSYYINLAETDIKTEIHLIDIYVQPNKAQQNLGYYCYKKYQNQLKAGKECQYSYLVFGTNEATEILQGKDYSPIDVGDDKSEYILGLGCFIDACFDDEKDSIVDIYSLDSEDFSYLVDEYNKWCIENGRFFTKYDEAPVLLGFYCER